jgi:hypothetical protein
LTWSTKIVWGGELKVSFAAVPTMARGGTCRPDPSVNASVVVSATTSVMVGAVTGTPSRNVIVTDTADSIRRPRWPGR